jgi:O-antigen/teichoic acid export membrane protein
MGIVIKQGFYNSFWLAVGVIIGYVNTILLFPVFLTADQFGLTRILWAAGTVFGLFALLGSPQVLVKFFPDFGKQPKVRGEFFMFMLLIPLLGFIIFLLAAWVFKGQIITSYANGSPLFKDNFSFIYVITFFFIYFSVLEAYLRALFKTTVAVFLKNVLLRIFWLILVLLYQKKVIGFETFLFWFVNAYGIVLLILLIYAAALKELKFSLHLHFLKKEHLRTMAEFGLFVILGSSTAYLANYIDIFMVGGMINLKSVAFYSVAFYLGTVILLPFNGAANIIIPIISESFAKNKIQKIKEIYQESSTNLSLISTLIFLGIWLNANNIFSILPPQYEDGKYVLLFIALAKLLGVSTGVNAIILQFSPYFKTLFWFNLIFLFIVVISNYLLIPPMGITGAALATFLSQIFMSTLQVLYIRIKIKMFPFRINNLKVLILGGLVYLVVIFIPVQKNVTLDILFRSAIIILLYMPLAYFWNISSQYSGQVKKYLALISKSTPKNRS